MLNAVFRLLTVQRSTVRAGHAAPRSPGHLRREPLDLAARRFVRVDGQVGQRIRCLQGIVWITQDEDPTDMILGPGQVLQVHRRGTMLMFAIVDSRLAMDE
ncbi:DUF2917 domain-containing protein [Cupriavidus basilensis]